MIFAIAGTILIKADVQHPVEAVLDPPERVVAGQATREFEKFPEQSLPITREIGEVDATLSTAYRSGQRDRQRKRSGWSDEFARSVLGQMR